MSVDSEKASGKDEESEKDSNINKSNTDEDSGKEAMDIDADRDADGEDDNGSDEDKIHSGYLFCSLFPSSLFYSILQLKRNRVHPSNRVQPQPKVKSQLVTRKRANKRPPNCRRSLLR